MPKDFKSTHYINSIIINGQYTKVGTINVTNFIKRRIFQIEAEGKMIYIHYEEVTDDENENIIEDEKTPDIVVVYRVIESDQIYIEYIEKV